MKCTFVFILFLSSAGFAQNPVFKELRYKPNPSFYNTPATTINYPVIVTKNSVADKLINDKIRDGVLGSGNEKLNKEIISEINEGLINLSYKVTFRKNGILSLNIYREDCNAHCSSSYTWLNFDLKTGKSIDITDLIADNKIDSLKQLVFRDKIRFLDKYKAGEQQVLAAKEIDSAAYSWILSEVDSSCARNLSVTDFSLCDGYLEIIDPCEFPSVIRSQEPDYQLKYTYKKLHTFLKPGYRGRLLK